jgi:hypothetical protein
MRSSSSRRDSVARPWPNSGTCCCVDSPEGSLRFGSLQRGVRRLASGRSFPESVRHGLDRRRRASSVPSASTSSRRLGAASRRLATARSTSTRVRQPEASSASGGMTVDALKSRLHRAAPRFVTGSGRCSRRPHRRPRPRAPTSCVPSPRSSRTSSTPALAPNGSARRRTCVVHPQVRCDGDALRACRTSQPAELTPDVQERIRTTIVRWLRSRS